MYTFQDDPDWEKAIEQLLLLDRSIANKKFSVIKKRLETALKVPALNIDEDSLDAFMFFKLAEMEVITITFSSSLSLFHHLFLRLQILRIMKR